jgi:DNA-binding LytR/AlgR family response regulator
MSRIPEPAVANSSVASGSALRTFLVEDSPVIRENLIATLEEMTPVQVVGSADEEGAAKRWLDDPSHECELVIVDVVLRSGSGLGVLRAADRVFDKSSELDDLIAFCVDMGDGPARA